MVLRAGEPTHFSVPGRPKSLEVVSMDLLPVPTVTPRPGTGSDASRPARWNWIPGNVSFSHRSYCLRCLRSDWIDVAEPNFRSWRASDELQNRCNRVAVDHAHHSDGAARPFHSKARAPSSSRHPSIWNTWSASQR